MTVRGGATSPAQSGQFKVRESMTIISGFVNESQDGVVVDPKGISMTHTAGHGNCPKVIMYEY